MLGRKAVRLRLYPGWDFIAYKGFVILSWPQTLYVAKDDLELLILLGAWITDKGKSGSEPKTSFMHCPN